MAQVLASRNPHYTVSADGIALFDPKLNEAAANFEKLTAFVKKIRFRFPHKPTGDAYIDPAGYNYPTQPVKDEIRENVTPNTRDIYSTAPLDLGAYASGDADVGMLKGIIKIQAITRGKHMRENEVKLYHNDNDSMPDLVDASVTTASDLGSEHDRGLQRPRPHRRLRQRPRGRERGQALPQRQRLDARPRRASVTTASDLGSEHDLVAFNDPGHTGACDNVARTGCANFDIPDTRSDYDAAMMHAQHAHVMQTTAFLGANVMSPPQNQPLRSLSPTKQLEVPATAIVPPFVPVMSGESITLRLQAWVYFVTWVQYAANHITRKCYTNLGDMYNPSKILGVGLYGSALCIFLLIFGMWNGFYDLGPFMTNGYFLGVYLIFGFFQAIGGPVGTSIMGNWMVTPGAKKRRGLIYGTWTTHQYFGNIVAPVIIIGCNAVGAKWWWGLMWAVIINASWGVVCHLCLPYSPESHARAEAAAASGSVNAAPEEARQGISIKQALAIPSVPGYCIAFGFMKTINYVLFFWLPLFLQTHFDSDTANMISTLYDFGMMPGGIIVGVVSDAMGGRRGCVIVVFLIILCPLLFCMALAGGNKAALGTVVGLINGSGSFVAAIGQMLVPYITDALGWSALWYFMLVSTVISCFLMLPKIYPSSSATTPPVHRYSFRDNIGGRDFESDLAYEPIDVVYTTTTGRCTTPTGGGDPYYGAPLEDPPAEVPATDGNGTNATGGGAPAVDESVAASRYRDSDELRYSLRSLEKYAPWVRHVYLVTDDQIPWWLDMASDRLTVVPHRKVFARTHREFLPVFSSPAIETQLHNIPGLSKRFIYFNDDVMLGAETWPSDFATLRGAPRIYLAWEVPKCNDGCNENWIGDGTCDVACNVSACDFDGPDCANGTSAVPTSKKWASSGSSASTPKKHRCATGCPSTWLGDGSCDKKCDSRACAYDAGDCGGPARFENDLPGGGVGEPVVLRVGDRRLREPERELVRKVPAHMPHMIDRDVVGAIQKKYAEPWRETASHRFRSGRDVQYAFAYFHYVMGTFDAAAPDLDELWRVEISVEIDADGSGSLDGNEVVTLAAMALGKEPDDAYVDEIYACASSERVGAALRRWWRRLLSPRFATAAAADRGDRWADPAALDSIRARRTKFICVNDNVDDMTPELAALFRDFFASYYPRRSQFELPPGSRNRHLRLEAYERDAPGRLAAGLAVALAAWGAAAALRRRTTAGAGEDEGKGKAE
ncbi:hypothetical protein JL722_1965 [Aureococcus anophagefferens]|nr:hypothetical protein JL722_1965 [Aureococcus anophagefferens]